jgi:cephalosporin-C deacetylase-like acetyl esterase
MHLLHGLLNEIILKDAEMSHVIDNQLTYVKDLGAATRIKADAIANMSTTIRDNIIQPSEQFQQITRDMLRAEYVVHIY